MFNMEIRSIGTRYSRDVQMVDTVEMCDGFIVIDKDNLKHKFIIGDKFRDGQIIDCFIHPESDCIWMIVCYDEYYFEVYFDNYKDYNIIWNTLIN